MHEKIVFFEWPKWTDCTDFFKFDQKIARNLQLMFQIVRIFRIFSQQKTFFFRFWLNKSQFLHENYSWKFSLKKVSSNWFSAYFLHSDILDWLLFQLPIKIYSFIFSRIFSRSVHSRIFSRNTWRPTIKTLQYGYLVLREQFSFDFYNRGVIETLKKVFF